MHLIVSASGDISLSNIIRDFKRYMAKTIIELLKSDESEPRKRLILWLFRSNGEVSTSNEYYKVWIHENHPVILETNLMLEQRMEYVHQNPVKAGICYEAEDYVYSSASYYAGRESLLPISPI